MSGFSSDGVTPGNPMGMASEWGPETARDGVALHTDPNSYATNPGPLLPVPVQSWPMFRPRPDEAPATGAGDKKSVLGSLFSRDGLVRGGTRRTNEERRSARHGPLVGSPADGRSDPEQRGLNTEGANELARVGAGPNAGNRVSVTGRASITEPVWHMDRAGPFDDIAGGMQQDPTTFEHEALRVFRGAAPWVPVVPNCVNRNVVLATGVVVDQEIPSGAVCVRFSYSVPILWVGMGERAFIPSASNAGTTTNPLNDGPVLNPLMSVFYFCANKRMISLLTPSAGAAMSLQFYVQAG